MARARENEIPIVEANVGVTLIISKGEIEIPASASQGNRDWQEKRFLAERQKEIPMRNKKRRDRVRKSTFDGLYLRSTGFPYWSNRDQRSSGQVSDRHGLGELDKARDVELSQESEAERGAISR